MRAVVIGTGHIARQHIACLKTLAGVELAGVCDLSPAMAESAAERFGVPRWFTDHRAMLAETKPDVVHITTPPASHYPLAVDALAADAHVVVEKPVTVGYDEFVRLRDLADQKRRVLVEDHNYQFDPSVLQILHLINNGDFGDVVHVEVNLCLNILGPGSRFADANSPHPCLSMPGGAIADFLTHLSYLSYIFVGAHRAVKTVWSKRDRTSIVPHDEFRALLDAERGTANLSFSSHAQPDVFWLRVYGTKMRAAANLFEPRLTVDRLTGGPRPLMPVRNGIREARDVGRSAFGGLRRKLAGGPGPYTGLWELLDRTYRALADGHEPPVNMRQIENVNRLVADLTREENRL